MAITAATPNRCTLDSMLIRLLLLATLSGCVAPKAGPFEKYAASLATLREGVEGAVSNDAIESEQKFIEKASNATDRDAGTMVSDQLRLRISPRDSFAFDLPPDPALFLAVREADRALKEINDAFTRHAKLLVQLVGSTVTSVEEIDKTAADINASAKDFIDGLNLAKTAMNGESAALIDVPGRDLAIVSAGASEALRQYLLHKQSEALNTSIDSSLPAVTKYAESVQLLIEAVAIGERSRYSRAAKLIDDTLAQGGLNHDQRHDIIVQAISLNDAFASTMDKLRTMHEAYGKIPAAFASLKAAAGGPPTSFKDLQELAADARRVVKRYDTIKKSNATTP